MSPSSNLKMPIDDWTGDDVFEAPVDQSRDICSTQHPIDTLDGTVPVYVSSDCSSADDEACSHKDDDACYICVECKRMLHLSAFSPCQILLNLDQRKCQVCVAEDLSNQSDSMHENCTKSASDGEAAAAMNYQRDTRTADKQAAELHVDGDEQNQVPRECAEPASSAMLADEPDATHDQCADGAGFPPSHVFSAFQFVDAKNRSGCWHQACIVRCNISCIRVHFIGCSRDNDETIVRSRFPSRVRPLSQDTPIGSGSTETLEALRSMYLLLPLPAPLVESSQDPLDSSELRPFMRCDVRERDGDWYDAVVVRGSTKNDSSVKIHFVGWSKNTAIIIKRRDYAARIRPYSGRLFVHHPYVALQSHVSLFHRHM
jgi:hypothetical protein